MHYILETAVLDIAPNVYSIGGGIDFKYILMEYLNSSLLSNEMSWLSPNLSLVRNVYRKVSSLHNSGINFPSNTSPFDYFWDYLSIIKDHNLPIPTYFSVIEPCYQTLLPFLLRKKFYKPCHFDLHGYNIFVNNLDEVKFIDWDCAGMGNIFFDLALLSLNFRLTDSQDEDMLRVYFSDNFDQENFIRFNIAKTLGLLLFSTREIVRPYFSLFPPFSSLVNIEKGDHYAMTELASKNYLPYDEMINIFREWRPIKHPSNLEVGLLMMCEGIARAKSDQLKNMIGLLLFKNHNRFLLKINQYLSRNVLRSFFLSNI